MCVQISDYSVWLMVAVTCERYLVVCHPFRASTFCSTPVARRLVLGLLLAFLGLNAHFFWTVGVVRYCLHGQPHYQCSAADSNYAALVTVCHHTTSARRLTVTTPLLSQYVISLIVSDMNQRPLFTGVQLLENWPDQGGIRMDSDRFCNKFKDSLTHTHTTAATTTTTTTTQTFVKRKMSAIIIESKVLV